VTPNWIVNLLKHFNDDSIAMVGPRTNNIGNEASIDIKYNSLDEMVQKSYDIYYENVDKQYEMNVLAFFCVAVKREIIDEIGLLDEIYGIGMFEDDDYCQNVKNAGYRLVCADDVFIHHHLGASFDKDPEWKEKLFQKNKAIFESRHGVWIPHKYRE
jgi:GT2 family glycosyltransferase